jgi:RNA polymerase sigma factor (sigma-70 family)
VTALALARPAPAAASLPPFQRFLDEHRDGVLRFLVAAVGPVEADDCFQETFTAALRAYPRLRADSDLRAWVMTIAHRKALDSHRARARRPVPVAEIEDSVAPTRGGIAEHDPWAAARTLPAGQRAALLLRFGADLSHAQLAEALGCSETAARRRVHDALDNLRKAMA